jgi:hypothetical protein
MADLTSNLVKMNDIEVAPEAPLSEALEAKEGENINGLIDKVEELEETDEEILDALDTKATVSLVATFNSLPYPAIYEIVGKDNSGSLGVWLRATPTGAGSPDDRLIATASYDSSFLGPYMFSVKSSGVSGNVATVKVYSLSVFS